MSLALLVERVLHQYLEKEEGIRMSKWSNQQLSNEQLVYAASDAVAGLEIYREAYRCSDLTSRLNDTEAVVGKSVIIGPQSGSLPTMTLCIGKAEILETNFGTKYTLEIDGVRPKKMTLNRNRRLVKISEVNAPSYFVPTLRDASGNRIRFGELQLPCVLVLPLRMMSRVVNRERPLQTISRIEHRIENSHDRTTLAAKSVTAFNAVYAELDTLRTKHPNVTFNDLPTHEPFGGFELQGPRRLRGPAASNVSRLLHQTYESDENQPSTGASLSPAVSRSTDGSLPGANSIAHASRESANDDINSTEAVTLVRAAMEAMSKTQCDESANSFLDPPPKQIRDQYVSLGVQMTVDTGDFLFIL